MRLSPALLGLALGLAHTFALAQCQVNKQAASNRDGSALRLTVKQCEDARERTVQVSYRGSASSPYRNVLRLQQDVDEAPTGQATLRDLDGDGVHELELSGMCGAGPNCEGTIYRLARNRGHMFRFFSGGYAQLTTVGPYLVESGRASCCAWEHHVYRPRSTFDEVKASDQRYRVLVGTGMGNDENDANDEPTCTFRDRRDRVVRPPLNSLLSLCEVYGPDYVLARPGSRRSAHRPAEPDGHPRLTSTPSGTTDEPLGR